MYMSNVSKLILISLSVFVVWTFATYILEGRVNLLQRVDPVGRMEYVVIANILVGTIFAFAMFKPSLRTSFVTDKQLGFQPARLTLILIVVAFALGFVLFLTGTPISINAIVVTNVFSQTLPTSIAEVVVCWGIVGTVFESLVRRKMDKEGDNINGKNRTISSRDRTRRRRNIATVSILSVTIGSVVSIVLFGIYHFAHSPPFNQPNMVLFVMIPAILTSIFYFVGREIYSTITIHNFLALIGIMGSIDVTPLAQPLYPIILIAVVSVLVLIASDMFLIRRAKIKDQL
jgi:hypothetical protein